MSEFSFGYALTEELVAGALGGLTAAPIFPSLIQEGAPGGGYDLKLPLVGAPLYLQFKLSDCMVYRSAAEWDDFGHSYYRMHLRPQRHSEQHGMLCDLQAAGNEVYYVAPYFHTTEELNLHYAARAVANNSVWFQPLDIDYLPDNDDHYVAFDRVLPDGLFCSRDGRQTKKLTSNFAGEHVRRYVDRAKRPVDQQFFTQEVEKLLALPRRHRETLAPLRTLEFHQRRRAGRELEAQFAAYLSRSVLDAELLVVAAPDNP